MHNQNQEELTHLYPSNPSIDSSDKNNVFRVTRGQICSRTEKWSEIKKVCEGTDLKEIQKFISGLKDSNDYSGILHTNTFRVDKPIGLAGLGFFGPFDVETAAYDILVEVEQFQAKKSTCFSTSFHRVSAQKQKIFDVHFNPPVMIQPNIFYEIRFMLNGPKTSICDPDTLKREFYGNSFDESNILFEFLNGSLQMPDVLYIPL